MMWLALPRRMANDQQNHEAGNAEEKADSMGDAIDDFFEREAWACHVNGYINIVSRCVARRK